MRIAVTNGTISETTDYLEQHAPGIFDIRADALPHKYRAAQIAALGAWYVSLPREELLQRLEPAPRKTMEDHDHRTARMDL